MLTQEELLRLLNELVEYQHKKVFDLARQSVPGITVEDLRNPQDFAILMSNARFNFEDGILAGYISARTAVLAEINMLHK